MAAVHGIRVRRQAGVRDSAGVTQRALGWPARLTSIAFGGDYNPEQWDEDVWAEDVRLMHEAGVNLVTVNVFGWAEIEPAPGQYDFERVDRVMDLLAAGGIHVDLATGTASPPPWFSLRHPETLPMTREGVHLSPGGRQAWCPSSPVFRQAALALVEAVATRYADHQALVMWHVSNELGCHNAHCYCEVSAEAFRGWLRRRYGWLDRLNEAWATSFWSQRYGDWDEVLPPRAVAAIANPTQQLDFRRFSSDELLDHFRAERDLLRRITPTVPVTTNFMVTEHIDALDYATWAPEQDVVSNDHYLVAAHPDAHVELAFCADRTRGLAGGDPWFLMEHSTSAVNWQPRNVAKRPGEMLRNSLVHVARGADAVCFFQWRASRGGAEKYHSALVPHAGTDTKVWREVVMLGQVLDTLGEVRGTRVEADVALLVDYPAQWAVELDSHPSVDVDGLDRAHALYRAAWDLGVTVDVVPPSVDLTRYRAVLVPTLYLVSDHDATALTRYVEGGGHVLVTYFSGIVDEHDHVRLGGYPGAFRDLLGIRVEEFFPLRRGEFVRLDDGTTADVWTELLHPAGADVVTRYADGPLPDVPAVTRRAVGDGVAWYMGTRLDRPGTHRLVARVLSEAGAHPVREVPAGVEVVRRVGPDHAYLFVANHTAERVDVPGTGTDLVTGAPCDGSVGVGAGEVAVVRQAG